jgi:hypothetical protein
MKALSGFPKEPYFLVFSDFQRNKLGKDPAHRLTLWNHRLPAATHSPENLLCNGFLSLKTNRHPFWLQPVVVLGYSQ